MTADATFQANVLTRAVAEIFVRVGLTQADAERVATDLVSADMEGVASHGVMLVPMYVDRIRGGSVSTASQGEVVSDRGAAVVIDGGHVLGQLSAHQAVKLAIERAKLFGVGVSAVRNAFHFGAAGRYARLMADAGCIGIVMSNTRPLMPAPGGAEPLTGNNPIAIAVPSTAPYAAEVDMALSAAAMGKIRNAAAAGQAIPLGWATDRAGADTTDPEQAIAGMLLPAAGPKGFGLAFIIDLLCGGLSGGGIGSEVRPLFGPPDQPYACAHLFLAIHVGHFAEPTAFGRRVQSALATVSSSQCAPGVERVFAPGELAHDARRRADGVCHLAPATLAQLTATATMLGLDITSILDLQRAS